MVKPTRYTEDEIQEYYRSGQWLPLTLADVWDKNAREHPDREALTDGLRRETWASAKLAIDKLALGLLSLGFKKDEILVIQLPNCVELVLLRIACEKAGVLCLPVVRSLRQREIERILADVKARGIVIPWKYRDLDYHAMVSEIRPRLPALKHVMVAGDDRPPGAMLLKDLLAGPALTAQQVQRLGASGYAPHEVSMINHTSGTTGFPKFVEYSMAARLALGRGFVENFRLTEKDVVCALGSVPAGVNNVAYFAAPQAASKTVWLEHFEAGDALSLIEKERATVVCGVPAMYALMVKYPRCRDHDLSSVRVWWCGSAFLPYPLAVEVEEKLGAKIVNGLGAVDFGGTTVGGPEDSRETRILTVGKPRSGTLIKIVGEDGGEVEQGAVGEIWGSGPASSSGYYLNPEATWQTWTRDGWFRTGDLGRFDDDGNVLIVGRKKEVIIRGGQNIYPAEIEGLLAAHPKIAAVALVGMPDAIMGEKACAYVVPRGGQQLGLEDVVQFLKGQDIAPYKIPERLELVAELPMVAGLQKVNKKVLQEDIAMKLGNAA
ncbi:MAG: AMP-binding protein [Chloroflexi bacterium]|nr:AMP-binding protein [Chloroflexota bacterium]